MSVWSVPSTADGGTTVLRTVLGAPLLAAEVGGYHAFLPLPRHLADAVVAAAGSEAVDLTSPASLMAAPGSHRSGIRLCLGGPTWADLTSGLATVRDAVSRCTEAQTSPAAM